MRLEETFPQLRMLLSSRPVLLWPPQHAADLQTFQRLSQRAVTLVIFHHSAAKQIPPWWERPWLSRSVETDTSKQNKRECWLFVSSLMMTSFAGVRPGLLETDSSLCTFTERKLRGN